MRVEFYRGEKPLGAQELPSITFSGGHGAPEALELVPLPPRIPVALKVAVGTDPFSDRDKLPALRAVDRIELVAVIEGVRTIRTPLSLWNDLETQEERC